MPVVFGVGSLAFVTNIGEGQYPVGSNRDPIASGQHSLAFTGPRGGCEEPPHAIHTGRGGLVTDQQQVCYTIHVNICGTHLGVGQDPVSAKTRCHVALAPTSTNSSIDTKSSSLYRSANNARSTICPRPNPILTASRKNIKPDFSAFLRGLNPQSQGQFAFGEHAPCHEKNGP